MVVLGRLRRSLVLSLFFLLSLTRAFAAPALQADASVVCPGYAILFTASGFSDPSGIFVWEKSSDKVNWSIFKSTHGELSAAEDMDDVDVEYFRVRDVDYNYSNVVSVTKSTSSDCGKTCHVTSTGDFFDGTDFDPLNSSGTATIPDGVVQFFSENNLIFENGGVSNYTVTTSVKDYLGKNPSLDTDEMNNAYYVVDEPNGRTFNIKFPASENVGKYYRFIIRMYIKLKAGCDQCQSNALLTRTGHGCQTYDALSTEIYDDDTNELLGSMLFDNCDPRLNIGSYYCGRDASHLYRIEATYYGKFPDNTNGLQYFSFYTEFQQMNCALIAVDYISAEIESVCMTSGSVCVGTSTTVNAKGFPKDAVYVWEEETSSGVWSTMTYGGLTLSGSEYKAVNIPVTAVGKKHYRVRDANTDVTVDFYVTGKDCNPVQIDTIVGADKICAPGSETYEVQPSDASESVSYIWKLYNPNGQEINDKTVIYEAADRGVQINVRIPDDAVNYPTGTYKLTVQTLKTNSIGITDAVGNILTKEIQVYSRPNSSFSLTGLNSDGSICPSNIHTKLTGVANDATLSSYQWSVNTSMLLNGNPAEIDFTTAVQSQLCAGTLSYVPVVLTVSDSHGCYSTSTNSFKVSNGNALQIDCKSLSNVSVNLGARESSKNVTLPVPSITTSCEDNPKVVISGSGNLADGTPYSFTKEAFYQDMKSGAADMVLKSVPATSKAGISVTYTASDACNTSSCSITVNVNDVTAPDLACDLTNYTAHTDNYSGCVAVPGENSELPLLTIPEQIDLNGVDGKIKGVYKGRWENCLVSNPSSDESLYDATIDLNASFSVGVTYILWAFSDNSGNTTYCKQKVEVIDNKAPIADCPDQTLMHVSVDATSDQCGATLEGVLKNFDDYFKSQNMYPSAQDQCSNTDVIDWNNARHFYKTATGTSWTEVTDASTITFKLGETYDLAWRFYKVSSAASVDKTVYAECLQQFVVDDSVPPVTNCSSLRDTTVTINVNNNSSWTYTYASGSGSSSSTTYTLKGFFTSWPTAYDVCDGKTIQPVVTVEAPDGTVSSVASLSALQSFRFPMAEAGTSGQSIVRYTYTDSKGNVSYCEQFITVYDKQAPLIEGCKDSVVLYANDDCLGVWDIQSADIPSASVMYTYDVRRKQYMSTFTQFWTLECPKASAVVNVTDSEFSSLSSVKDSSGLKTVKPVYPVKIIKVTNLNADGSKSANSTETVIDGLATKSLDKQVVLHDCVDWWGNVNENLSRQVVSTLELQTTPISLSLFNDAFKTFEKGNHKVIFVFDNGDGLQDSCVVPVVVRDTTGPNVVCGKWDEDKTLYADSDCEVDAKTVALTKPELSDLNATDNCTAAADLKLTWQRVNPDMSVITDLTALLGNPFTVGVSTVSWFVTDDDGNSSVCKQIIDVKDTLGPVDDCSSVVKAPSIEVYADENCVVLPANIGGLVQPIAPDDKCSPTGSTIAGVGERIYEGAADGKDIFKDAYLKGVTIINWTFTDALDNKSVCPQVITVKDTTRPYAPMCDSLRKNPIVYDLSPEECELPLENLKKRFGNYYAEDNCSDTPIPGVPYLLVGGSYVDLPSVFAKNNTYEIAWIFTDEVKNQEVCIQQLMVNDTTPPDTNGVCPAPYKEIDATTSCSLGFDELNLPELKINDKCDGELLGVLSGVIQQPENTVVYAPQQKSFDEIHYYIGTHHFTWTFTDLAGLESTCEMDLKINDKTPPAIDNCDVRQEDTMAMSVGVCYADIEDVLNLLVVPRGHDVCEDSMRGSEYPLDPVEVQRWYEGQLMASGDITSWRENKVVDLGKTTFIWIFEDSSGNRSQCEKSVVIVSKTTPDFDCSQIDPDTIHPLALAGDCSVPYSAVTFEKDYYGTNACTGEYIKAQLSVGSGPTVIKPVSLDLEVGRVYTFYWLVRDRDGNVKSCPQWIEPYHQNKIIYDCNQLQDSIVMKALEGECWIPAANVGLDVPYTQDSCLIANGITPETIYAVGTRSDSLGMNEDFSTGVTVVTWTFVSPYNPTDTAICTQVVDIRGNKKFDLDCDIVCPEQRDTVDDCNASQKLVAETPWVADPCITDSTDSRFRRYGVGTRSDGKALDAPFELGTTTVKWVFTDFTETIVDSCLQNFVVLTSLRPETPCNNGNEMDTIKTPSPADGECTINSSDIPFVQPVVVNPCNNAPLVVTMRRPGITDLNSPYAIGLNEVHWVFTDTTGTLAYSVDSCIQFVQVGDVAVKPIDCDNYPDQNIVLDKDNCEIDFTQIGLTIPDVIDQCPNGKATGAEIIKPLITRTSKPGWSTDDASQIGSFGLGRDTVYWQYNISGITYTCLQQISVKDSIAPEFDCSQLDPLVKVVAPTGTCVAPLDTVLSNLQQPVAYDKCLGNAHPIHGVLTLADGSDLPATFAVGDTFHLKWTFIDTTINTVAKECSQDVLVVSDIAPVFDCNSLDTLKFIAYGACQTVLTTDSIPVPVAKDYCTGIDVPGVGTRIPGDYSLEGSYVLGFHTIRWIFTSPFSVTSDTCLQTVWVRTDQEIDAHCDELQDTIKVDVEDGICQVPASLVNLPNQRIADVPCHSYTIEGVPSRSDNLTMTDSFPVGITVITWTFTDESQTLLTPVTTCKQYVQVGDRNTPLIDCEKSFPDTTIYLDKDNCTVDFAQISFSIGEMPVNNCNGDVATLDTSRQSGKAITDPYEVGSDVIIWNFKFAMTNQSYVCRQQISVKDTLAPDFDCNQLTSPLIVPLTTEKPSVSYAEVQNAGFYVPVVTDPCGDVKTETTRADGKAVEDEYPFGSTFVTFSFTDINGNVKTCEQEIRVTDMIPPELTCPDDFDNAKCLTDNTMPVVYSTFEEFKQAGGSVSDESKLKDGSFAMTESVVGDNCQSVVTRTYSVSDKRDQVATCNQVITVKDDVAPVWSDDVELSKTVTVSCSDELPNFPDYTATDNCSEATVTYTDESNRSSDPTACEYYSYDLTRTYVATDDCGNQSAKAVYVIQVRDESEPVISLPEGWTEDYVVSDYLKGCMFGVPDVANLMPEGSFYDNCVDEKNLEIWQSPAAGDTIFETTYVDIFIKDICGNVTSTQKKVYVPTRESVVSISADSFNSICGGDGNQVSLLSPEIRTTKGSIWIYDDGEWFTKATSFNFDYYRGELDEDHLIYSNNPLTYKDRFVDPVTGKENVTTRYELTKLTRRTQSDTYIFVAMDTLTLCSDTAVVYIDVKEKPRVTLDSTILRICEHDSLPTVEMYANYNVCVDDMGSDVTGEGWMLGDSVYALNSLLTVADSSKTVAYYATNGCGTTSSSYSLFNTCLVGLTTEDSLSIAGSEIDLTLWRSDVLYSDIEIPLDIHVRFDSKQIVLATDPQDKARVWEGDDMTLSLHSPYEISSFYWYKVVGDFDGRVPDCFDNNGYVKDSMRIVGDEEDERVEVSYSSSFNANEYTAVGMTDSTTFYVLVSDDVCPAVASNLVSVDVLKQLPTAITPYTKDGLNDVFMAGHSVAIFNRYGQLVYEGNNGWDGSYRGLLADPGVYYYEVAMANGIIRKGSIEVVKIK